MRAEKGVQKIRVPSARIWNGPAHPARQTVAWMGRDGAKKTLAVALTGFAVSRRMEWLNARYGKLAAGLLDKMNIILASHGRICAVAITDGSANDSPVLGELPVFLPPVQGADGLDDAAHASI